MNNKNLISVIMSVYNNQNTVEESINSILNQSYKNIEFLIIDDSSEDNTYKVLAQFQNHKDIKLFRNTDNLGLTKSLNKLIAYSKGDYIARQDGDDISYKKRLELQHNFLNENKLDFCTCSAEDIQTKRKLRKFTNVLPEKFTLRFKNPFIHGTLLIRKDSLTDIGGYDEDFIYAQDYKLFVDLVRNGSKFKNINKVLYKLNTTNNISVNKKDIQGYYADCVKNNLRPDGRR
ncbi:hypothetical protein CM15mP35_01090 [bacterium]|jgi:glycosyltransferase involved in cell wall biosynthesis|nr:MAG: hypothetical protein CM15mP35_01090 [bacterium]|tara:strand:- start:10429 stop:11124 length:696 start_codon:yes stop_codon:yes gene_type:complete